MFEGFRKTVLALTAGLTALGGVGAANAQGIYLDFDDGNGPRVGIYGAQEGPTQGGHSYRRHDRERDRWDRDGHDRWDRDGRDRRGRDCTPARALDKAERPKFLETASMESSVFIVPSFAVTGSRVSFLSSPRRLRPPGEAAPPHRLASLGTSPPARGRGIQAG